MVMGQKAKLTEGVAGEIRHASRRLARSPTFTFASVLTLALSIGASVSIFAIVYHVVLNPLPYPDSDELVFLDHAMPRIGIPSGIGMTSGLYFQYLDRARTLDAVAVYRTGESTLTGNGEPERIRVAATSNTLSSVLQVQPALGRWFTEEEGLPGGPRVALLAHGLWRSRFGGDPGVLSRAVTLDGVPTQIIGVMPASFAFPDPKVDAWVLEHLTRASGFGLPFSYSGVARASTAAIEKVRAELNRLIADLPRAYPGDQGVLGNIGVGGLESAPTTLKEAMVGDITRLLWILLAAVGLVLLIACTNVTNLFLVRSEARHREVALRRTLGAGEGRIARFFLAESGLISALGGIGALALAWGAVRLLVRFGPTTLPRLEEVVLDPVAVGFAGLICLVVALIFGTIPLLRAKPLAAALRETGRSNTTSRRGHQARRLLMGGQVALALVLLIASGLMVRSFQNLRRLDPSFDPNAALTFRIGLPEGKYPTRASAVAAHQGILDQLSAIPAVTASSSTSALPLNSGCFGNSVIAQASEPSADQTRVSALLCAVADGYIEAMGIPLLRGRGIGPGDLEQPEPAVAVVNQAFVDVLFADQDPMGERVRSNAPPTSEPRPDGAGGWTWDGAPPWLTIVGVVANTPTRALAETTPVPRLYMPMSVAGGPDIPAIAMHGPDVRGMTYVVRSATSALAVLPSARSAVHAIDSELALAQVRTLQDILDEGSAQTAFTMVLLAIAAVTALLLGLIGICGVTSYMVSQRTGEIGLRLALGLEPGSAVRMIVGQGGLVALAGIIVGLIAALAGSRLLESLLYDISPRDLSVFMVAAVILLLVSLFACWLPARRAARLSPVAALRAD